MKIFFFICQRVWKTVICQRKIREKSGNLEVDDKWQPWYTLYRLSSVLLSSVICPCPDRRDCTVWAILVHNIDKRH